MDGAQFKKTYLLQKKKEEEESEYEEIEVVSGVAVRGARGVSREGMPSREGMSQKPAARVSLMPAQYAKDGKSEGSRCC